MRANFGQRCEYCDDESADAMRRMCPFLHDAKIQEVLLSMEFPGVVQGSGAFGDGRVMLIPPRGG